jgi:cytochrome c5
MVRSSLLFSAACLMVFVVAASARAQAPKPKVVTTATGVYTARQAARGEQTYMNICVACHPPGTYTAQAFREKWNGAPLSQLFGLVSNTMPKEQPGTLEADEYAEVIAYLLKINGAPAGKTELPSDPAPMKRIRIVMPTGR